MTQVRVLPLVIRHYIALEAMAHWNSGCFPMNIMVDLSSSLRQVYKRLSEGIEVLLKGDGNTIGSREEEAIFGAGIWMGIWGFPRMAVSH